MYVNGKMTPIKTIPGCGRGLQENDRGVISRMMFVNTRIYPQNNKKKKKRKMQVFYSRLPQSCFLVQTQNFCLNISFKCKVIINSIKLYYVFISLVD
jgi:hypothetical protein